MMSKLVEQAQKLFEEQLNKDTEIVYKRLKQVVESYKKPANGKAKI